MPTEHYRSEEAYRKARAYTHIHGIPTHAEYVVVAGKKHKVKHSKGNAKKHRKTTRKKTHHKKIAGK